MRQFAIIVCVLLLWSSTSMGKEGKEAPASTTSGEGAKPKATPTPAQTTKEQPSTKPPAPAEAPKVKEQPTPTTTPAPPKATSKTEPPAPAKPTPKTEFPAAAKATPKTDPPAPAVVEEPKKVPEKPKVVEKLGEIKVKAGIMNVDTKAGEWKDLAKGQTLPGPLQLHEVQERLNVKISATRKLHQVFVLLRNKATDEEVGFIGQLESDQGSNYKVDIDIASTGFEAGTYEIILYLGDFLIEDSLEWVLGELNFKVTGSEHQFKARPAVNPLYSISYEQKPEIKHQFRQPEPRPSKVVSDAFTLLVLSPFVVLFFLWIKIGVNISNFPFTLSALSFHLGLTALFGVYALFWIKLTMFEALKWMGPPGIVTFVAGNRLLNYIAERRTK